jgi:uroporphyrin-3 C-methyltransferase
MSDLQRRSLASENTKLLDQLETLQQQVSTLQQQGQAFKSNAEQLSSNLSLQNDSVKQLSQQLQALSAEQGRDPLLWRVAEVEYLLSVANNRLQLERDSKTALVALQDADRRLETLGDPALIPIRKTIAGEIIALNSVETPDITGMAVRLSSLVDGIETLPLVSRERLKTAETQSDSQLVNSFSQFWANLLKDLKSVVTIRRSGEPIEPLLPPDEQYYLSQNLGLKLQEARLALLRRETGAFRQDLNDTRQWVEQFFDKESASVGNVISTLDAMETVNLKPDLPDISGSLRQLRHWMALQQQSKKSSAPAGIPNEDKG